MDVFVAALVSTHVVNTTDTNERTTNTGIQAIYITLKALGTISLASIIFSLIYACKTMMEMRMRNSNRRNNDEGLDIVAIILFILELVLLVFLSFLSALIECVNKFALCYTAIKGTNFKESITKSQECIQDGNIIAINSYFACEYTIYALEMVNILIIFGTNFGYYHFFLDNSTKGDILIVVLFLSITCMLFTNFIRSITMAANTLSFLFILKKETVMKYSSSLHDSLIKISL